MLSLDSSNDFELYLLPTDMRKSFDSLSGIIISELGAVPFDGKVYLFVNRLHNKIKILHWRTGGFVLYYKRLERGVFRLPKYDQTVKSICLDCRPLPIKGQKRNILEEMLYLSTYL